MYLYNLQPRRLLVPSDRFRCKRKIVVLRKKTRTTCARRPAPPGIAGFAPALAVLPDWNFACIEPGISAAALAHGIANRIGFRNEPLRAKRLRATCGIVAAGRDECLCSHGKQVASSGKSRIGIRGDRRVDGFAIVRLFS
jgi:hypothetical protein